MVVRAGSDTRSSFTPPLLPTHTHTMSLRRLKGVSVTVPFYTFNVASPLTGKKSANSDHTHQWTVGIRGFHGDLTFMIKKVTFRLHETYADPVRGEDNKAIHMRIYLT